MLPFNHYLQLARERGCIPPRFCNQLDSSILLSSLCNIGPTVANLISGQSANSRRLKCKFYHNRSIDSTLGIGTISSVRLASVEPDQLLSTLSTGVLQGARYTTDWSLAIQSSIQSSLYSRIALVVRSNNFYRSRQAWLCDEPVQIIGLLVDEWITLSDLNCIRASDPNYIARLGDPQLGLLPIHLYPFQYSAQPTPDIGLEQFISYTPVLINILDRLPLDVLCDWYEDGPDRLQMFIHQHYGGAKLERLVYDRALEDHVDHLLSNVRIESFYWRKFDTPPIRVEGSAVYELQAWHYGLFDSSVYTVNQTKILAIDTWLDLLSLRLPNTSIVIGSEYFMSSEAEPLKILVRVQGNVRELETQWIQSIRSRVIQITTTGIFSHSVAIVDEIICNFRSVIVRFEGAPFEELLIPRMKRQDFSVVPPERNIDRRIAWIVNTQKLYILASFYNLYVCMAAKSLSKR